MISRKPKPPGKSAAGPAEPSAKAFLSCREEKNGKALRKNPDQQKIHHFPVLLMQERLYFDCDAFDSSSKQRCLLTHLPKKVYYATDFSCILISSTLY